MAALTLGEALLAVELYDLNEHFWELENLAYDSIHREDLKRLLHQLQTWSLETNDESTALRTHSDNSDTLLRQLTVTVAAKDQE